MTGTDQVHISRYRQWDEKSMRRLIDEYQQRIFALVLYLLGGARDKAYEIATSSFVETLCKTSSFVRSNVFLIKLTRIAVDKSRNAEVIPSADEPDFTDLPPEKREMLHILKLALQTLSFNSRARLLLRDQVHMTYKQISDVFRVSESKARIEVGQAKLELREKTEEILARGR